MNSYPCLYLEEGYDAAATTTALHAFVTIALAVPGSISRNHHNELGRLLSPIVDHIALEAESKEGNASAWYEERHQALGKSLYKYHDWVGTSLDQATPCTEPLFREVLDHLAALPGTGNFARSKLAAVGQAFSLFELELRLLSLAVAVSNAPCSWSMLDLSWPCYKTSRALAAATGAKVCEIDEVLQPNGMLAHCGLLRLGTTSRSSSVRELLALSSFGHRLFQGRVRVEASLLEAVARPWKPEPVSSLGWKGLQAEKTLAEAILANAIENREEGVNLLLYGQPATGKTAFAQALLGHLECDAYEVPARDDSGRAITGPDRLRSLALAQSAVDPRRPVAFIMEDTHSLDRDLTAALLDEDNDSGVSPEWALALVRNRHPVIWTSEPVDDLNSKALQPFTMCIHFEAPNADLRRNLAQRTLSPMGVSDDVIACLAQRKDLCEELVSASARAVMLAGGQAGSHDNVVLCHIKNHARLIGAPALAMQPVATTRFDSGYLHVQGRFTADQVMEALARNGRGTLLMSGPPGTGKTLLARKIADKLDRELVCMTASDINSRWFGASERNVAKIFSDCNPREQVLFIDEAEILMGARDHAEHRASEAVTAEFLRQLDQFDGVFVCATNHAKRFDAALMRRFTFRLEFKSLSVAQRESLLAEIALQGTRKDLPVECRHALNRLDGLTPGDFANVQKRFALLGQSATLEQWINELRQEWLAKPEKPSGMPMGFV